MYPVIYILIILVFSFYFWNKRLFTYWQRRGFLQANGSFPLGSFTGTGSKRTDFETLDIIYRKFKGKTPIVGIYSSLSPGLFVIDPDLLKSILVGDFESFHCRGMYQNKVRETQTFSKDTESGIFFFRKMIQFPQTY